MRQRQNGRHFADNIFNCIFLNENVWFSTQISLNLVPEGPICNKSALVQVMASLAWNQAAHKSLSKPLLTQIAEANSGHMVTRSQWVKGPFCDMFMNFFTNWFGVFFILFKFYFSNFLCSSANFSVVFFMKPHGPDLWCHLMSLGHRELNHIYQLLT